MGGMPLQKDFTQVETSDYNKFQASGARICIANIGCQVEHAGPRLIGPHIGEELWF